MSPAKVARFWAMLQLGKGEYQAIREELFAGETVETLIRRSGCTRRSRRLTTDE
jgi:hypothetical protein